MKPYFQQEKTKLSNFWHLKIGIYIFFYLRRFLQAQQGNFQHWPFWLELNISTTKESYVKLRIPATSLSCGAGRFLSNGNAQLLHSLGLHQGVNGIRFLLSYEIINVLVSIADQHHLVADPHHLGADPYYLFAVPHYLVADPHHLVADPHHLTADPHQLVADPHYLVADPHHLDADEDPAFNFDAELDANFYFDADPTPRQSDAVLRPQASDSDPLRLYCEPLFWASSSPFWLLSLSSSRIWLWCGSGSGFWLWCGCWSGSGFLKWFRSGSATLAVRNLLCSSQKTLWKYRIIPIVSMTICFPKLCLARFFNLLGFTNDTDEKSVIF